MSVPEKHPDRKLDDAAKTYIINALACFETPSTVTKAIKEDLGIIVSAQLVEYYDPTKRAGRRLPDRWKVLFEKARRAFIDDTSTIPISHRSTRLRALQRMADRAEEKGNFPLAAQLLKQAAEEMGNAYTNKREITGRDGKDLPVSAPAVAIFALPDNGRGG
jgi:hypothetical protein